MNTYKGGSSAMGSDQMGGDKSAVDTYSRMQSAKIKGGSKDLVHPPSGKSAEGSSGTNTYKGTGAGCCDAAPMAPSLPEPGALHGYLGHFAGSDVLKKGHNTSRPKLADDSGYGPPPGTGTVPVTPRETPQAATNLAKVVAPVATRDSQGNVGSVAKNVDKLGARSARRAIKSGNAAVAAERPVLAAKVARRAAVKAGVPADINAAQAAVKAARSNPESARMERKARKEAAKPRLWM